MRVNEQCGVGIIGYGPQTAARTFHVPLVDSEFHLGLRAVSARNPNAVAPPAPGCAVVGSAEELIAHPGVGLVVVALPNTMHFDTAKLALEAGKHVVVEKPMAPTSSQADELIALAAAKKLVLTQFHNRRWDGGFLTTQKLLADGAVGDPVAYEAHYDRWEPVAAPGWRTASGAGAGTLYDLGTHLVDQAIGLFGRPHSVAAVIRAQRNGAEADDYFDVQLDYGRLQARLGASMLAALPRPRYMLSGTEGTYTKFGIDYQAVMLNEGHRPGQEGWGEDPPAEYGQFSDGARSVAVPTERGAYEAFYRGIAASIFDGTSLPVPVEDARDGIAVIEAAFRSNETGRRIYADEMNLLVPPKSLLH